MMPRSTRGRVWVGTMAYDKRPGNAALYRVDGEIATCVVDGLTISNGPAFDDDAAASTWPTPRSGSCTCSTSTPHR